MSRPIPIPSSTPVHDQESKVVKHGSKIFTSTLRKEQKEQSRQNSHHGSPDMSITSKSGQVTPTPSLSPILNEVKMESEVDSSNGVSPFPAQINGTKSRSNQGHQNYRSQSFSYTPSYNNYHKSHSRGFSRNVTGVNHLGNDPSPDSSNRSSSSNSNRVAALTGNNLRSGPNNRGGRRGGFNNRFPNRNPPPQNGLNMYPRYPTPQYMFPMAYPYYPGTIPMAIPPQPGTPVMVPDPGCSCNDCLSYYANIAGVWNPGYYPPVGLAPPMIQQQVGAPFSGDGTPRPLVPVGPFYQTPMAAPRYLPDYATFVAQQQAFVYQQQQQQQQQVTLAGGNPLARGNAQPESKNELTPIEPPGPVAQAQYSDNFYAPSQQPYYILPAGALNQPANYAGDSGRAVPQPYNASTNVPGNTLPYTLRPDCVIQNTPTQHKR